MMDTNERQRMEAELEAKLGFNVATRTALDAQIKQFKRLEGMLGKQSLQSAINSQPISQLQKDYIYLRMGWL